MGLLDGKVVLITGGGRGIGRDTALIAARQGAKVIVNDLGAGIHGEGADRSPAQEVVDLIKADGGEAIANFDSVTDLRAVGRMVRPRSTPMARCTPSPIPPASCATAWRTT
jgi:NAD(P)-dependent dehydrogenase (short-subunit alcohol dehydrogenase family)